MARQILPWIGAGIGAMIGGPAGARWGFMIGSLVGNVVDPQVIKGPSIGDGQVQTSKEGVVIPRIYGTACVSGNIIDISPNRKSIKRTKQGKGGPVTEEERLHRDFAIGICCHEVNALLRIWADEKLVYDVRENGSQVADDENAKYGQNFKFYKGDELQFPDPTLEAIHGVGNTPAYRGLCYIVFANMDLTDRRGSVPNYRFEVSKGGVIDVYPDEKIKSLPYLASTLNNLNVCRLLAQGYFNISNTINVYDGQQTSRVFLSNLGIVQLKVRLPWEDYPDYITPYTTTNKFGYLPYRAYFVNDDTGETVFSSGWICDESQQSDLNDVFEIRPDLEDYFRQTKFVVGDENVFDFEEEFRFDKDLNLRMVCETLFYTGVLSGNTYINSRGICNCYVDIPDETEIYNPFDYKPNPEFPASIVNKTDSDDVVWLSWADDHYTKEGAGYPDKLGVILQDITELCSVGLDKIDVEEVYDIPVRGLVVAQQYDAKNVITALQQSYFFDPSEYDEQLHFVLRGKDVTKTLTIDDFVDDPFEQERKSAIEYPKKLNLLFQNATIGYDSAKATAERNSPNVQVSGERTIEVPVVLLEDEAAQIADKQLKIAWAEAAGTYKFTLPCNLYDEFVPADVFGVYLRGQTQRMRIEKIERADGMLKIEAKIDRQSAYTSNVTGIPLPAPPPPPPTIAGESVFAYLNIPALVDANDLLGYYVSATGETEAYYGTVLERKTDGVEEEFYSVKSLPLGKTIGELLSVVNDASEHYSDTTNVVHLQLYNPVDFEVFQEITQDVLLRENNGIAICRPDGTAEIIQFRDVEDIGEGEYKLSYLLRGRLNSGTDSHAIGAKVVWLEDVELVIADASEIGDTFIHRPVSYGESPEDATLYTNDFDQPLIQTEFPVDLLNVEIVGTNAEVSWSPRERFGTDITPIRSVNWTNYHLVYTDGTTTIEADTLVPEHVQDVSSFTGTLSVTVYQVNRYTGNGPGVSQSVDL